MGKKRKLIPVAIEYKRNENKIVQQIQAYIDSTYDAHYVGDKSLQVTDIWEDMGIAKEAYRSNIVKYAIRAGKKGDQEKQDVMKIIHYAIFLLNEINRKEEE